MKHLLLSLILFPLAMQAQIDQFYQENADGAEDYGGRIANKAG